MIQLIKLIRISQYYKNLVIFLPIIFIGQLISAESLLKVILGFIALCLMSSVNYIINDIVDIKKDKHHPEKKTRPLVSGKIRIWQAKIISVIFFLVAIAISLPLSTSFLYAILSLFGLTQLYSFLFKKYIFADILTISINFVIRAIAGAFILRITVLPWVFLCPFFLSLFLLAGKRKAEIILLKGNFHNCRDVLKDYTEPIINTLIAITTTLLIVIYILYSIFTNSQALILALPFALCTILRYLYLIYSGSEIARYPEKAIKDIPLFIGSLLWIAAAFLIIYLF